MIAHHIREEDRKTFFYEYYYPYMKWAAGMTLDNARILDAVLGKQVKLIKMSDN